jgi:hypothetical protein
MLRLPCRRSPTRQGGALGRKDSAPKERTCATVRVTSEAAKANHRSGAEMAARDPFPCGNRAITGTGAAQAPMVNGVRTDMVNER